jgi:hypothetical protein
MMQQDKLKLEKRLIDTQIENEKLKKEIEKLKKIIKKLRGEK